MPEENKSQPASLSTIKPEQAAGPGMIDLDIAPTPASHSSTFSSNKGLILALVIGVIVIIVGITALFSFGSSNQYQGMIRQVDQETQAINNSQ